MFIEFYNLLNVGSDAAVYLISSIICLPLSILLFIYRKKIKFKELKPTPYMLFIISVLFIPLYITKSTEYRYYRNIILDKKHIVLEGTIEDFKPYESGVREYEEFTLNGKTFRYSDFENRVGFRNMAFMDGPLYPGATIRVFYYDDTILGLWIKE